ncbi:MAG: hypothetical protein HFJ42_04205 [Clostridia bacterium]|nr:hypothetical protein [Clostridia bacterium]
MERDFSYVAIWTAVSAAVITGIIKTKNAFCLLAFLIPALITPNEYEECTDYNDCDDDEEKF